MIYFRELTFSKFFRKSNFREWGQNLQNSQKLFFAKINQLKVYYEDNSLKKIFAKVFAKGHTEVCILLLKDGGLKSQKRLTIYPQ